MESVNPSLTGVRPVIISAFGPPSLACIRSWGRCGMIPGMVCIQEAGASAPASKYLAGGITLSSTDLYTKRGIEIISNFLLEFNASGVTCIDESIAQWINQHRSNLPGDVAFWIPANEMLQRVLNKATQIGVARRVGLSVLPTYFFSRTDSLGKIPDEHFPLCLRPSVPGAVTPQFKAKSVRSPGELQDFLGTLSCYQAIIGQPFRNLPNLVVHGTRTETGETINIEGFLVARKFQGVTLTLQPVFIEDKLKAQCIAFTRALNLVGPYHFEFLHDPLTRENYFLEINHRFGGTTAKVFACGYQEPIYALYAYGINCLTHGELNGAKVSNFKALLKNALFSLTGRLTAMDYPIESSFQRMLSLLECLFFCRDEVFARDDIKGSIAFYFGRVPVMLSKSLCVLSNLFSFFYRGTRIS